jgi:hypothetical protein
VLIGIDLVADLVDGSGKSLSVKISLSFPWF